MKQFLQASSLFEVLSCSNTPKHGNALEIEGVCKISLLLEIICRFDKQGQKCKILLQI